MLTSVLAPFQSSYCAASRPELKASERAERERSALEEKRRRREEKEVRRRAYEEARAAEKDADDGQQVAAPRDAGDSPAVDVLPVMTASSGETAVYSVTGAGPIRKLVRYLTISELCSILDIRYLCLKSGLNKLNLPVMFGKNESQSLCRTLIN